MSRSRHRGDRGRGGLAGPVAAGTLGIWAAMWPVDQALAGIYEIVQSTGRILALRPADTEWTEIGKGARLPEGTLIQVTAGTVIEVRGVKIDGASGVPSGFTVEYPLAMVTRLSRDSRRVTELAGYFPAVSAEVLEENQKRKAREGGTPPVETIDTVRRSVRQAWQRVAMLFSSGGGDTQDRDPTSTIEAPGDSQEHPKPPAVDDVAPLVIAFPANGQSFLVESLPTSLVVNWRRPDGYAAPRSYRVLLKPKATGNAQVLGETADETLRFQIREAGFYAVAVETTDGRFRSSDHMISVQTFD